jgi:type IV pilus assembly protein PilW
MQLKNGMVPWRRSVGFSLIELMLSMVVGLLLVAGVITVFVNSRSVYDTSQSQIQMVDEARFALQLIGDDLRLAGHYGRNTMAEQVERRRNDTVKLPLDNMTLGTDCEAGWYINLERKIFASNNANPYPATCINPDAGYRLNTDVLVVRYANVVAVDDAAASVGGGVIFVQGEPALRGELFNNDQALPTLSPDNNFRLLAHAYYVSDFTDEAGDGIPSLHRISLVAGPTLIDEVIATGVEDFQVQFGLDTDACTPALCDDSANYYVNADHADLDWNDPESADNIRAVRVWLLMRSEDEERGLKASKEFEVGGEKSTFNDGFRRLLLSNVFQVRNRQIRTES